MSSDAGTATSERSISGVLSRSSVYTTLRSLDDAATAAESKTTTTTTVSTAATPSSNKKLLQFYAQLSTAHHHRQSERLDGKNTAARPLSAAGVASRIETRSLTLTGGGYNSNVLAAASSLSSSQVKNQSTSIPTTSNRKRKRQHRKLLRRLGAVATSSSDFQSNPLNSHYDASQTNLHFLLELNAHWNQYMSQILSLSQNPPRTGSSSDADAEDNVRTLNIKVRSLVDEIEWVGARVMVVQPNGRHGAPRHGILVSQTLQTWRVACLPPTAFSAIGGSATRSNNDSSDVASATVVDASSNNGTMRSLRLGKTITVLKQPGVSLIVLVPLPPPLKQSSGESPVPATKGRFLKVVLEPSKR